MEKVKKYLLENLSELESIVRELNSWDGSLEHLAVFENDEEFFDMFFYDKPMDAVRACFYGKYKYMDEYVRFNGYGNLESLSRYDYEEELKNNIDDIIDELERKHDYLNYLNLSEELKELLNYYDEDNEDNDEDNK